VNEQSQAHQHEKREVPRNDLPDHAHRLVTGHLGVEQLRASAKPSRVSARAHNKQAPHGRPTPLAQGRLYGRERTCAQPAWE
jgi:hypothetical protein